ncbi:MAG: 50S ribosomal protein L22 [Anaerolineae bacterium]|jgi:large subunit ribosomal protein L22
MEDFEVRAELRHVAQSARKVRLVVDRVRGMDALAALDVLRLLPHRGARSVHKVISSAVANAENNFGMMGEDLYVAEISADDGPIRRWRRFGARGRFKPIQKRSAHITVVLRERTPEI